MERFDGHCLGRIHVKDGLFISLRFYSIHSDIYVCITWFLQEAGGKVTDSRGESLDFSLGAKLPREVWNGLDWMSRVMLPTLMRMVLYIYRRKT